MSGNLEGRTIHVDQHLSNVAINYQQDRWIGEAVFPVVPVGKQSDTYVIHEQADLFRSPDTKRSRGTEAHKITSQVSSASFYCENYALKSDITIEDRANADPIFVRQLEEGKVRRVTDGLLLDWEKRLAGTINVANAANVGSFTAVDSTWTDHVNSNPLENFWTSRDVVRNATGYSPNRMILGVQEWAHFRQNKNVRDSSKNPNVTAGDMMPTVAEVAQFLELDELLVGMAYENTEEEGIAQTLTPVWSGAALLYYAPPAPSIDEPSYGYSFRWSAPGLPNFGVERHPYDSRRHVDEVEVGYYQDEVITSLPLSFLMSGAVA